MTNNRAISVMISIKIAMQKHGVSDPIFDDDDSKKKGSKSPRKN